MHEFTSAPIQHHLTRRVRKIASLCILSMIALVISACSLVVMPEEPPISGAETATDAAAETATIPVGIVIPMSGEYSWIGERVVATTNLLAAQINAAGGINDTPLEIIVGDSAGDLATGTAAAQRLIEQDNVVAIIGPTSLSFSGIKPLLEEHGLAMISPTAGTIEMDRAGTQYFFRTAPSDSLGGRALAHAILNSEEHLAGNRYANVVLMMGQAPVYLSFLDSLTAGLQAGGVDFAATLDIQLAQGDYSEEVAAALSANADLIVLIAGPDDSAVIMQTAADAGYAGDWLMAQDQTSDDYIALVGDDLVEGAFGMQEVTVETSAARMADFRAQYTAATGQEPERFAASTYDAATILFLAIEHAALHDGEVTRANVASSIHAVANAGADKVQVTNFADGKAELAAGNDIDFEGLDGSLNFDEYGNIAAPFGIFQAQSGVWQPISTVEISELE